VLDIENVVNEFSIITKVSDKTFRIVATINNFLI
jgi:hypothetical protein